MDEERGIETKVLPAMEMCPAKKYINELLKRIDEVGRDLCTDKCSGYNTSCKYWLEANPEYKE